MDTPHQIPVRAHARNKSIPKATRPRSTTKGPLDVDDISLSSPKPNDVGATFLSPDPNPPGSSLRSTSPNVLSPRGSRSPARSPGPGPSPRLPPQLPKKDFSFLLRPEIYHTLSPQNVPAAFRNSPHQPAPDTPIPELISKGHFRAAAVAAVQQLTGTAGHDPPAPDDHARIFSLIHTRLACLTLIDATPIAAQEVKALEDVQSPFYLAQPVASPKSGVGSPGLGLGIDGPGPLRSPNPSLLHAPLEEPPEHLVPWELRVLAVRLQSLGFGDPRRSVMSYYELAREARARLARASAVHDNSARELHKERLAELGLKVAGALIEMDDLAGAAAHLETLVDHGASGKLATAKALLWLHLGDVDAARRCVDNQVQGDATQDKVISALCDMADGDYDAALAAWAELREDLPNDEMVAVNMAACLLYVGKLSQGREMLEAMVDSGFASHTLLFNLTTMYELCTDKARPLKQRLVERVAEMEPNLNGWEKTNANFKL
ncbi:hypothetical protein MCOR03_009330 [Pyricularia oryzae]|nr:hypothetical protein MCOR19_010474 [Pyricularia oryzae]KAI6284043.1 hypothetical protein MCOR26_002171 [Pyricularia oryzae]KAI6340328.1 hypothetical protein MCOR28_006642 [Pyricularia oryzae]KAI6471109.1 hypothetical protein MCOR18_008823 [Pyricularia oryzae]KAI6487965.1 hypothetical protein MCOR13_009063 [Pyricularia oryzae]